MNIIKVVTIYPEENINVYSNFMAIDPIVDMSVWTDRVTNTTNKDDSLPLFSSSS